MKAVPLREQIRSNAVALISLVIAVTSLGYNTWRNETTEAQRNTRHAAFRVLENLGELQEVVDYRRYYLASSANADEGESRLRGYGSVSLVRDLMMLMPEPAPEAGEALFDAWHEQVGSLSRRGADGRAGDDALTAERDLTRSINDTRDAVLAVLKQLE